MKLHWLCKRITIERGVKDGSIPTSSRWIERIKHWLPICRARTGAHDRTSWLVHRRHSRRLHEDHIPNWQEEAAILPCHYGWLIAIGYGRFQEITGESKIKLGSKDSLQAKMGLPFGLLNNTDRDIQISFYQAIMDKATILHHKENRLGVSSVIIEWIV